MEIIKPLNNKVNMFASNDELYDKLTDKEIITIKLAKLDEFANDLYRLDHSLSHHSLLEKNLRLVYC